MLGALIGDIAGSTRESRRSKVRSRDFELFPDGSHMTDDSFMTMAVLDGAVRGLGDPRRTHIEIATAMREFGQTHRRRGYGGMFGRWLDDYSLGAYNSFGNGAAMRVSPIAWLYGSLEEVETYAMISAMPTHGHPEGLRGARAVAGSIFLALEGAGKDDIEGYVTGRCGYELPESVEYLRETYEFDVTCGGSVPPAVLCFLSSGSFEECIRNVIYIGGDCDTLAAIAGGIAEAMWGIPAALREEALSVIERDRTSGLRPEVEKRANALAYIRGAHRRELPPEDRY